MKLSELGEFGLIRRLEEILPAGGADVLCGIGDDCAVLEASADGLPLLTTDLLVEAVHFRRGADPLLLGRKALAVSLSDVAAMGGRPLHALASIAAPADLSVEAVESLVRGMAELAEEHGVAVIGGDTTASASGLILSTTVVGEVRRNAVVYRSGARPGDLLFLSRPVGDSLAGLQIVRGRRLPRLFPPRIKDALLRRHLDPEPEVAAGQAIGESGDATAMIDLSDGLGRDLGQICRQSRVRAEVIADSLPLSAELEAYAGAIEQSAQDLALRSGEEYALLYTVPSASAGRVSDAMALAAGRRPVCIGRITEGSGAFLVRTDGEREDLSGSGHEHFRSEP